MTLFSLENLVMPLFYFNLIVFFITFLIYLELKSDFSTKINSNRKILGSYILYILARSLIYKNDTLAVSCQVVSVILEWSKNITSAAVGFY
jgi:hypothetical protein